MAKAVGYNFYLSIGSDVSAFVKDMIANPSYEELDSTTSNTTGARERLAGLADWEIKVTLANDFADASIDDILFAALGVQTAIVAKFVGPTTSAANPKYTGNGIFFDYPVGGLVGAMSETTITIKGSDGVPMARTESDA